MKKFSMLVIASIIILSSCEQEIDEVMEPSVVLEIQTASSINSTFDCYQEMTIGLGEDFTGTACSICSSFSANPGETITVYGVAYFHDANIQTFENLDYNIIWTMVEGNANFTPTDDPRMIQLQMPEAFDKVVIKLENLASNGLAVSEFLTIRNATQPIEIGDPGQAGRVIHDKGVRSDEWQFMETTQFFVGSNNTDDRFEMAWGTLDQRTGIESTEIGTGKANTVALVNHFLDPENQTNQANTLSAWIASEHSQNGFSDWHIPSLEEAKILIQNNETLSEDPNETQRLFIWTSTEVDADHAFAIDLFTGEVSVEEKNEKLKTIGVRYF
ncbi:MAG: hypothetical protein R8G66_09565 [Cytophagales bacterium]|nr:hypothetical protein [Cytophagales bacterium]